MKHYFIFFITGLMLFFSANLAFAVLLPSSSFDYLYLYEDGQKIMDNSVTVHGIDNNSNSFDCGYPMDYNGYWVCQAYEKTQKLEIRKSSDPTFVIQIELPIPRDSKVRNSLPSPPPGMTGGGGGTIGLDRYFDVDIETGKVVENKSRYYVEKMKKYKILLLNFGAISILILILGSLVLIRKRRRKNI